MLKTGIPYLQPRFFILCTYEVYDEGAVLLIPSLTEHFSQLAAPYCLKYDICYLPT